jgi:D-arabinose 1-dehydrogenase-like Zn-dependent alcohol dehydrogenase
MIATKAIAIEGSLTGTLSEARELIALARAGKISSIPIRNRPLEQAQDALDDLRAGHVVGRTILTT